MTVYRVHMSLKPVSELEVWTHLEAKLEVFSSCGEAGFEWSLVDPWFPQPVTVAAGEADTWEQARMAGFVAFNMLYPNCRPVSVTRDRVWLDAATRIKVAIGEVAGQPVRWNVWYDHPTTAEIIVDVSLSGEAPNYEAAIAASQEASARVLRMIATV